MRINMETKKILTANLQPDMLTAEAVYNRSNHLIISSKTKLTPDIINKLKYYSIKSVKVCISEAVDNNTGSDTQTYFRKIQSSAEFQTFEKEYDNCLKEFKSELNDFVVKNSDGIVENMLQHVNSIFSKSRNPLHLLEMMQCMKNYDEITFAHSLNVALICNIIGIWLKFERNELNLLITAGLLHDIGKLKIPPEIIKKPGKLTDEEYAIIRNHSQYGYEILCTKNLDEKIIYAAYQHHEKYNGKGYPNKLSGSEINLFSSIVAIADVYDAMTSNRSYRKGICPFHVLEQMEREIASYDPNILHIFIRNTVEAYVNSEVMLSTGEKGRVIMLNRSFLSRPTVMTDNNTYDLSKNFDVQITELL